MGLGLGPETLRLKELLPHSRVNLDANGLPGALATLLVQSLRGARILAPQTQERTI